MEQRIQDFISRIAEEKGVEILFAAESGSRAWGFPSQDSDYDIRFIYKSSPEQYLSLEKRKDTIEQMEDKLLDGMGWDLQKTLKLAFSSNISPFEWLRSPIIYRDEDGFQSRLQEVIQPYFSPKTAVHHYLGIAEGIQRREWKGDRLRIKRYFYVLRPVLSARFVWENQAPPPIEFHDLLPLLAIHSNSLADTVEELIRLKSATNESNEVDRLPELEKYLLGQISEGRLRVGKLRQGSHNIEVLNDFFRATILGD